MSELATVEPVQFPLKPAKAGLATRWTPAQAKVMARKAHETRRKNTLERLERLAQYRELPANTGNVMPPVLAARALVVEDLIRLTESCFKQASSPFIQSKTAKDMQCLAMALHKLYEIWSLITGHERPGVRLPQDESKEKQAMVIPLPEPILEQGIPGPDSQPLPDVASTQG